MSMATETEKRSKRRRGNGEGCIFQRKDGTWCATIGVGYDRDGKPIRKWLYAATKREVQEKLTRLQSRKLDGVLTDPGRLTVKQFLDKWLETTAKPSIRATTHANYQAAIRNHIALAIGGRQLAKLTPADVQGMYARMESQGASAYTRRLAHAVLHRACKQALRWGMIGRNPVDAVDAPRLPTSDIHPLTAEQSKELLAAAKGDRLEALYVLALTTGMRLGELLGLQWADVDLEARYLTVCHALQDVSGKLTLAEPKTAKSRRKVELSALAVEALIAHRKRSLRIGGYVFRNTDGGPIRRTHFHAYCFKPLLKRAGLPDMRFHDLRHTAASLLLAAGKHVKVVQEILGHSTPTVTLNVYSHTMPTMQREAVDCLGSMLESAAG
jgi:integrase